MRNGWFDGDRIRHAMRVCKCAEPRYVRRLSLSNERDAEVVSLGDDFASLKNQLEIAFRIQTASDDQVWAIQKTRVRPSERLWFPIRRILNNSDAEPEASTLLEKPRNLGIHRDDPIRNPRAPSLSHVH